MKATYRLGLSYLFLFFTTLLSYVNAIPTIESITSALDSTIQARARVPTVPDIRNLAAELLAVQIIGAQATPGGIASLCADFDLSRLETEGYNTTSINHIFCQAASNTAAPLPSIEEVTALVIQYSSWIWISQAVGALKGDAHRLKILCYLIDVPSAFSVGQNGTLVKDQICNVGNGGELPVVPLPAFT
ncbi:MAG: hypothetical protein Q9225_006916 [Loekoesia sp. 1 TL-2023]